MSVNDIYEDIEQIRADIDQRVKHPYLMKFIDVPVIDDQKLFLLYMVLNQSNLSPEKIKHYIMITMLIQIALDTHEQVSIENMDDNDPMMKNRQLTVLAGDYYSGLYYYLLALVDDIPMINILSNAIKEINEHKISIYQKDSSGLDELMNSISTIDSLLIQKIAEFVHNSELQQLSKELLLVSRLNQEKRKLKSHGFSIVIDGIRSILEKNIGSFKASDPNQVLNVIDLQIKNSLLYIEMFLRKNSGMYDVFHDKVNDLINHLDINKEKAVKEG